MDVSTLSGERISQMADTKKLETIEFNGVSIPVEKDSALWKKLMKAQEDALEAQFSEHRTTALNKIKTAINEAYKGLSETEKMAMATQSIVGHFSGTKMRDWLPTLTNRVKIMERAKRTTTADGSSGESEQTSTTGDATADTDKTDPNTKA